MRDLGWFGIGCAVLIAAGCVRVTASAKQKTVSLERAVKGYTAWKAANKKLYHVALKNWVLCRPPTPEEEARLGDRFHGGAIRVYVNKVGEKAMFSNKPFPVGSVIVKERRTLDTGSIDSFTVMRKREAGYHPACGDWEFAILDRLGRTEEVGRLKGCVKCHADQKKLDYTFKTYVDKAR